MRYLVPANEIKVICLFLAIASLLMAPSPLIAAEEKERLVVMRVKGKGLMPDERRIYRTAIVEVLRDQYVVLAGDEVEKKVQEIYDRESEKDDCDTDKCLADVVMAFQAAIATAMVLKVEGGYMLKLKVNDLVEGRFDIYI